MATNAIGGAYGNVDGRLASGRAAVVACRAVRGGREAAVVHLGAGPSCGFVAALAVGDASVNRRGRLCADVARGALVADGDAAVEPGWRPGAETGFVAGVAVRDGHAGQAFVWRVVDCASISRREGATMAGGTLVGNSSLRVIEPARLPGTSAVAADAIAGGWNMDARFAGGVGAVVAARAVSGRRESAVINPGSGPQRGGMTADAIGRGGQMVPRLAGGVGAVVAAGAVGRRSERGVVGLGAFPACRLVAALAGRRGGQVVGGLADGQRVGPGVAGRALGADGDAGVQLGRRPGRKAGFVAALAAGVGANGGHVLVGNVVGCSAIGGRERAAVARRALAGHGHLGVAKFGRLPAGHGVAAQATDAGSHWYVYGGLAGGVGAVVAAGAVGRRSERGVVGLGAFPACRLVAAIAGRLGNDVPRRLSGRRTSVVA